MPDPYASIAQADEALQARLAGILELRAADIHQRAMLNLPFRIEASERSNRIGCWLWNRGRNQSSC
jgi:hypothetical protein